MSLDEEVDMLIISEQGLDADTFMEREANTYSSKAPRSAAEPAYTSVRVPKSPVLTATPSELYQDPLFQSIAADADSVYSS